MELEFRRLSTVWGFGHCREGLALKLRILVLLAGSANFCVQLFHYLITEHRVGTHVSASRFLLKLLEPLQFLTN